MRVYATRLAVTNLAELLTTLTPSLRAYFWELREEAIWEASLHLERLQANILRGHCFGPEIDLHIWPEDGEFHLVIAATQRLSINAEATLDLSELEAEETRYVLWGKRQGTGDWTDDDPTNVSFRYPVPGTPSRAAVHVIEYRDRETYTLQFVRYLNIVPFEEAQ
jgi:hypothetical protein